MKRPDNYIAANAENPFFSAKHILLQKPDPWATLFTQTRITIAICVLLFDRGFNSLQRLLADRLDVTANYFLSLSKKIFPVQKLLLTDHICLAEALRSLIKHIHNNLYSAGWRESVDKIIIQVNKMYGPGNRIF
jgi:hypothetical protein